MHQLTTDLSLLFVQRWGSCLILVADSDQLFRSHGGHLLYGMNYWYDSSGAGNKVWSPQGVFLPCISNPFRCFELLDTASSTLFVKWINDIVLINIYILRIPLKILGFLYCIAYMDWSQNNKYWIRIVGKKVWRNYTFVILGGVVKLQVTQSHWVGTQGSPSFVQMLSEDMERRALTTITTNWKQKNKNNDQLILVIL